MIAIELVQEAGANITQVLQALAHAPDAPTLIAAESPPKGLNTEGVVSFFAGKIAPILLAGLGVIFIGRASKGEISKVLTSSVIAIVGLGFIAGAATLYFIGDYLIKLIFG
ncbi:MAG TPA: hypothetical protein VFX61_09580 [Micromonosporaceae bacterium]|nr:hypothetical protein [Micromonosporaceae bacterium]